MLLQKTKRNIVDKISRISDNEAALNSQAHESHHSDHGQAANAITFL